MVFVTSEALDLVTLVRFGARGALIEHRTAVALDSIQNTAPRGIRVMPDGRGYVLTTTHGFPYGELLRATIAADSNPVMNQPPDTLTAREPVGDLPTAVDVTANGELAWVTNTGADRVSGKGSVSIVYLGAMTEAARIATCAGASGSRLTADGTHHYSVCTAENALVEIDAGEMALARRLTIPASAAETGDSVSCGPEAVDVSRDGTRIFVACGNSGEVVEVDAARWVVTRRTAIAGGVTQLAVTRDGRVVVVASRDSQAVVIIETSTGRETGRIATARHAPAAVVTSPDDKFAFVVVAGRAGEVGRVMMIDLAAARLVAAIDVAPRATAIDFWKVEASPRPK